jgi:hypothetical protein
LEEDQEILDLEQNWESDGSDGGVQLFNEKEDYELIRAVEEGLITPPWSDVNDSDGNSAFGPFIPFQAVDRAGMSNFQNDDSQVDLSKFAKVVCLGTFSVYALVQLSTAHLKVTGCKGEFIKGISHLHQKQRRSF